MLPNPALNPLLPDPEGLKLLLQAIHASLGPCRFEGTTFRSVALAIPIVRRAAEACAGGSFLNSRVRRDGSGRLLGQLTREAHWMFSTESMHLWPCLLRGRGYVVRRHHSWVYWDRGEGLPPRIDHVTKVRLPPGRFPVDDWLLPDGVAEAADVYRRSGMTRSHPSEHQSV
jgi:hypothetical protein